MRFAFFLTGSLLVFCNIGFAQSYAESALLFSRVTPGGSARIQGIGGAQTSLGGDFSSAGSNPAGLGMYNRSEIALSLGQRGYSNAARYFNTRTSEADSKLLIPGLGAVFNIPSGRQDGNFIGGSFAITYNRTNDFNNSIIYEGTNSMSGPVRSIIPSFIDQADGDYTSQFSEGAYNYNTLVGLAYYNFLIGPASTLDPSFPDYEYFTDVQSNFDENLSAAFQREEIRTSGATNQWNISYGANFTDRFFIGGGIGIASLRYESRKLFGESFAVDPFFERLSLEETLKIRGAGINATIGAIVRPVDFLQVGLSYTSPTYYELTETYEAFMTSKWKNFDYYGDGQTILNNESAGTDVVTSEYNFKAPARLSAGVSYITKYGFISGDIEYTNPSNAKYSSEVAGISFTPENRDISDMFKSTLNYRIGAEGRYNIFRLRAGYSVMSRATVGNYDDPVKAVSGGLGIRLQKFYVDFALIHRMTTLAYSPYSVGDSRPVVDVKGRETLGFITLGITY